MMPRAHLLESWPEIAALLARVRRIAVLGIKPESKADQPAHYVPKALQAEGLAIVPVPVYEFGVERILGETIVQRLSDVPPPTDLVNVFRRPADLAQHLPDLLALRPPAVWLQSGIREDAFVGQLLANGIEVVQDRCLMVDYRRWRSQR